jgi:hypothetical protein
VSHATDIKEARGSRSPEQIAEALRAQWRMIASVSLRPSREGEGFDAELHLDPIVVRASLDQQGHPRTPEQMNRIEARRLDALAGCVERMNEEHPPDERIKGFTIAG